MRRLVPASLLCWVALALVAGGDAHAREKAERFRAAVRALHEWNVPEAARLAEGLRDELPRDPDVAHLLGRVRLHQGDYDAAAALLEEASAKAEVGELLAIARDSGAILRGHRRVESEHFVLLYPPGKDEVMVPWALETLEAAYEKVGDLVGYHPRGPKIRVEIISNAEELSKISTLSLEAIKTTGTVAVCKFDKLMITSPKALLRGYEWRDTLAHEYVHLVVSRKSRNRTPIWLHEGIAKYLETAWRGAPGLDFSIPSQLLLQRAVQEKRLIPFEKMHPSIALLPTAEDAALAFAEVFTAIEFLQRDDPTRISRLLDELARGASDQEAVAAVHGAPFRRFEASWRQHLEQRRYPKAQASMESLQRRFLEDASEAEKEEENPFRGLTELSAFQQIRDAEARKAAHLGELLRARGKLAAAAAKYEQAYERVGPQFPSLSNKYAIALLELEEAEAAKRVLLATNEAFPGNGLTHLNLARAHMQLEEMDEARTHLESALSINPFNPEVFVRLQAVARSLGDSGLEQRAAHAAALLGVRRPQQ